MKFWFIMKKIFEMKTEEVFSCRLSLFSEESLDSKVGMRSTSAVIQAKSFPETKLERANISTYKHKKIDWKRTSKQITYYGSGASSDCKHMRLLVVSGASSKSKHMRLLLAVSGVHLLVVNICIFWL